jgi:hypothetical protein
MNAPSSHSLSDSASLFEPQNNEDFTNSIPLKPKAPELTTRSEKQEDLALDSQFAKPRKQRHHLGRNPCNLYTLQFLTDLLLTLAPCLFLFHSFLALSVNNDPISSSLGQRVELTAKLAPTLFPIIFAAVVGRLMRTYALWRAERGANLGIIELLNGSQNLLSAFERAILLPGLGFLSIVVMLLWALSPVGGQSALRVLSRKSLSSWNTTIIYYFDNTAAPEDEGAWESEMSFLQQENLINAIFAASINSLERVKGRDIWGNVKIPVLQYVHSYIVDQSKDGWYDFDENNYDSPYSSLTGIVVSGLKKGMETNFVIESSYFNLTCTEPVFFERNSIGREEFATWVGTLYHRRDNSSKLFQGDSPWWTSYMIDSNYVYKPYMVVEPRYNVIYASRANQDETAAYNCTVGLSHVESEVTCGSDCHVKRVRPSRNAIWSASGYPWPGTWEASRAVLLHWLDTFNKQFASGQICPLDFYVRGFDDPYSHDPHAPISYRNVSGLDVAKRLQSLINTGWQLGFQGPATAKKPEGNETVLMLSVGLNRTNPDIGYQVSAANATTIEKHDVFMSHKIWIAVTTVVSFILLLCGSLSMIFKYGINSPDVLGYVSSMTRDNPNFEQIPDGDRLDGLERARVLRHLKVQIVYVKPWDSDGYVTLKPVDQLKKEILY